MLHLQLSDREIERVLSGQRPSARSDLAEVARFVAQLRSTTAAESVPPMQPSLVEQLDAADHERRSVVRMARRRSDDAAKIEARNLAERAHKRWRLLGAAAIVVMVGGVVVAGMQTSPSPAPTETDGDLPPADRLVDPPDIPNTRVTEPPAAETPVTQPPPSEPQVGTPEAPPDPGATSGQQEQVWSETFAWPFEWPDECAQNDFDCFWDYFAANQDDGPGRPGDRPGGR